MNELPISSKYRSSPDEPVTDAEREQLSTRLNEAFTAGRLSQDDFTVRLDQLYAAHRLGDLVPVVEALPAIPAYRDPDIVEQDGPPPGELQPARAPRPALIGVLVGTVSVVVVLLMLVVVLGIVL